MTIQDIQQLAIVIVQRPNPNSVVAKLMIELDDIPINTYECIAKFLKPGTTLDEVLHAPDQSTALVQVTAVRVAGEWHHFIDVPPDAPVHTRSKSAPDTTYQHLLENVQHFVNVSIPGEPVTDLIEGNKVIDAHGHAQVTFGFVEEYQGKLYVDTFEHDIDGTHPESVPGALMFPALPESLCMAQQMKIAGVFMFYIEDDVFHYHTTVPLSTIIDHFRLGDATQRDIIRGNIDSRAKVGETFKEVHIYMHGVLGIGKEIMPINQSCADPDDLHQHCNHH